MPTKYQFNGFLNISKPINITSMEVVRRVKSLTGMRKKVGHGGTLDPLATGVLPICLGQATRLMEYIINGSKRYTMEIQLGISTTTYDSEGEILSKKSPKDVTARDIEESLDAFRGEILQIPPMYSALKQNGQRLYDLARKGVTVERNPRKVTVTNLVLTRFDTPNLTVDVECRRGLYLRSLGHDLGQVLGCGAHVTKLTRSCSGPFLLNDAQTLNQLETRNNELQNTILHPDFALNHLKSLRVGDLEKELLQRGAPIRLIDIADTTPHLESRRAYTSEGVFIGVIRFHRADGEWHPHKIFELNEHSPYAPS